MSAQEKRAHLRLSLQTEAWIAGEGEDQWLPVRLLDISVGGAAFLGKQAVPVGAERMLRFYLPGDPKRISFIAQVMHCVPHSYLDGFRGGLKIVNIHPGDRSLIERFIAEAGAAG